MMNSSYGAAQYHAVRNHGLVTDASPTRLVQIMFERILSHLGTAKGCMEQIIANRPVTQVIAKGTAIGKANRLIAQLNDSLDMERGGHIAQDLRALYLYMLGRLTEANATNNAAIVSEVSRLVSDVKLGWDQIVTDSR